MDWIISTEDRSKHDAQFQTLNPLNGKVNGANAVKFFLQSGLPQNVLAQIWQLSDYDVDGCLTNKEFSIAMALIKQKLLGHELPPVLPESLKRDPVAAAATMRPMMPPPQQSTYGVAPVGIPRPMPAQQQYAPPVAASSYGVAPAAVAAQSGAMIVPEDMKNRCLMAFTQLDARRTGKVSGAQMRNLMMQSGVPNAQLALIWNLSDMDKDGSLTQAEYVLCSYLLDYVRKGGVLPTTLSPVLIQSANVVASPIPAVVNSMSNGGLASSGSYDALSEAQKEHVQVDFEERRKENFSRGEQELERRRKALEEERRREGEARQAALRIEEEKQERKRAEAQARIDAEQKRLRDIREVEEKEAEEQRRKATEAREAARKEMEKKRQQEWEERRREQLTHLKLREKERLEQTHLRSSNIQVELDALNLKKGEMDGRVEEYKEKITSITSHVQTMRRPRDDKIETIENLRMQYQQEMVQASSIGVERAKMKKQIEILSDPQCDEIDRMNGEIRQAETAIAAMEAELTVERSADTGACKEELQILEKKMCNLEMNIRNIKEQCLAKQKVYRELHADKFPPPAVSSGGEEWGTSAFGNDPFTSNAFGDEAAAWPQEGGSAAWSSPHSNNNSTGIKYRVIHVFESRHDDELNVKPGDIIEKLTSSQDPHWIMACLCGQPERCGLVPETYLEIYEEDKDSISAEAPQPAGGREFFLAIHSYPGDLEGDLCFKEGDIIEVLKREGDWWTGMLNGETGIFPSNFVESEPMKTQSNNGLEVKTSNATVPVIQETLASPSTENKDKGTPKLTRKDSLTGKKEVVQAIAHFRPANGSEQLSLEPGQMITVKKKSESGWWYGESHSKGKNRQSGWFPANYARTWNGPSGSRSSSNRTTPVLPDQEQVITLYPYSKHNDDELSFGKDQIIIVLQKPDSDWWKGQIASSNETGMFPSNYVKPYS